MKNKTPQSPISQSESGNQSESSLSDTAISSGSPDNFNETKKKAEQGDVEAQSLLGVLYDRGKGVEQNHAEANKWYRLAAEQGLAWAQFNLGVSYSKGEGVKQNHTEAAKWYRLAAEQGDVEAQFNLGDLYSDGEGVKKKSRRSR